MADKVFADGLFTKIVKTQYWEIVKIWVKVEEFKAFLDTYENNWYVNLNLMTSKDWNKKYFELDTWTPDWSKKETTNDISVEEIPF